MPQAAPSSAHAARRRLGAAVVVATWKASSARFSQKASCGSSVMYSAMPETSANER